MEALTADMATDARITEAPTKMVTTGYERSAPTPYMLKVANRWHRVYSGSYTGHKRVVLKGKDYHLSGSAEIVIQTLQDGGTFADAMARLTGKAA